MRINLQIYDDVCLFNLITR